MLARPHFRQPQRLLPLAGRFIGPGSWAATPFGVSSAYGRFPLFRSGTVKLTTGLGGVAINADSTSAAFVPPVETLTLGSIAYLIQFYVTSTGFSYAAGVGWNGDGSGGGYVEEPFVVNLDVNGNNVAGNFRCSFRAQTNPTTRFGPTSAQYGTNELVTALVLLDSGSSGGATMFINGEQIPLSWSESAFIQPTSAKYTKRFAVGNFNYGNDSDSLSLGSSSLHITLFARLTTRNFDPYSLSTQPYQLFDNSERRLIVFPTSAAPTLVSASAVNIAITSFRPRVAFTR